MKRLIPLICSLFSAFAYGQVNLVPNPSFDDIDTCPYNQDQLYLAAPWFTPNHASSDLYNFCGTVVSSSAPQNWTGHQLPHSGYGYAGIAAYNYTYNGLDNRREYLATELLDTLEAGKTYCVEFFASLADSSYWRINRLGLYFSAEAIIDNLFIDTLSAIPQIQHDTNIIITDTMNWLHIHGTYVANGNERFITIGNFYADDQTDTIAQPNPWMWSYFYIDDVAVYELQECQAGADVAICYQDSAQLGVAPEPNVYYTWSPSDGLSDMNSANPKAAPELTTTYVLMQYECDVLTSDTVTVIVNQDCHAAPSIIMPTLLEGDQEFFISGLQSNSTLDIYNMRGRLVYSHSDYQNGFRVMELDAALYIAILTGPDGVQHTQKFCVVR